jgi:hypothetical protein
MNGVQASYVMLSGNFNGTCDNCLVDGNPMRNVRKELFIERFLYKVLPKPCFAQNFEPNRRATDKDYLPIGKYGENSRSIGL